MNRTALLVFLPALALAQVEDKETFRQTFSPAARLEVDNIMGSVRVTGHASGQILMVANRTIRADNQAALDQAKREVKIDSNASGDLLKLVVDGPFRCNCSDGRGWRDSHRAYHVRYDFEIQAPHAIAVKLRTVNNGEVWVKDIHGAFDLGNVNGGIEIIDARAGGSAHTVNGPVKLGFAAVPREAVSAKTVNGAITAGFPRSLNADLRFKTFNGDVFTDFATTALAAEAASGERQGTRYVYRQNRFFGVRVGGGGPEHKFETLNGTIRIEQRGQ